MTSPKELLYTADHEWALVQGNVVTVGITAHAQDALGDVVYVDLPKVGRSLNAHETFGVVESVKAVSDLFSPCAGKVVEFNQSVMDTPEQINQDPYQAGWLIKLEISGPEALEGLLSPEAYDALLAK